MGGDREHMTDQALYPQVIRTLESAVHQIESNQSIGGPNRKLFLEFLTSLEAKGIGQAQRLAYIHRLRPLLELLGETGFKEANKKVWENAFSKYRNGKSYKQTSLNKTIACLKCFARWVFDLGSDDPVPQQLRWLKKESSTNSIRPENLWTEAEIENVMNASSSLKFRAMLSVAVEGGLRPQELRKIFLKDLVWGENFVKIYVWHEKTKKTVPERVVPLVRSQEILKLYIRGHKGKANPDAWLWSDNGTAPPEGYFRRELKRLAEKCGIQKPAYGYIMRHTALTKFYKTYNTQIARRLSGHSENTKQIDTYLHIDESSIVDTILQSNGYEQKKKEETPLCVKCKTVLQLGSDFCSACQMPQTNEAMQQNFEYEQSLIKLAKAVLKRAEKNPEIVDMLLKSG